MSLTRIAGVSILVWVMTAMAVQVASGQDRGRRQRREARPGGQSRVVAQPPVARRYVAPRVVRVVPSNAFRYRPVYRPGLGIGIYIGSPRGYGYSRRYSPYYSSYAPSYYPYPQGYAYPPSYPYPAQTGIYAVPPREAFYGAVRLDVSPRDAAVYVDGYYAGIVDDFDGVLQRIALEPGPHHFEIVLPGYEALAFDVNVRPDQTVRYRGDMPRIVP